MQLNESDLAFLRRLLARVDGDLQIVGGELHVAPRSEVQRGTVELQLTSQLRRARLLADLSHQVTEVTVTGWDPARGERVSSTSTGADLGPGSGRPGAQLLRDIAPRAEHIGHVAVASDREAQALADASFDRRARRFVSVEALAEGNPALRVGTHVTLRGLGSRFDNTYYVVRASHRYDQTRGYETEFEAECAYLGAGA
jgi:phage protein D